MTPKISYKLNKALDKKMALAFLNVKAGGVNFFNSIIGVHPELKGINKQSKNKQKEIIDKHFNAFYKEHNQYLNKRIKEFQTDWNKVEKKYFQAITKIFKNYPWPKGKYIGYLSIIDCNPRFLNNKRRIKPIKNKIIKTKYIPEPIYTNIKLARIKFK